MLVGVSVVSVAGCAELFPKPHPDATGVVVVSCTAYEPLRPLDECEHRAAEACDGPALELSSNASPGFATRKGQAPDYVNVIARYQCTPR